MQSATTQSPIAPSASDWLQERSHIENVLIQRFNFLIVFVGVVLTAAVTTTNPGFRFLTFFAGLLICWLVALTLSRAQSKLDIIFGEMNDRYPDHPPAFADRLAAGPSRRHLIGVVIPQLCAILLLLATIGSGIILTVDNQWNTIWTSQRADHSNQNVVPANQATNAPSDLLPTSQESSLAVLSRWDRSLATSPEFIVACCSLVAAFGAWYVSWKEASRNNRVILRLHDVRGHVVSTRSRTDHRFDLCITNLGVQLADVQVRLEYYAKGRSGNVSVPLRLVESDQRVSIPFVRGATLRAGLDASDQSAPARRELSDFKEQRPRIVVYNGSFWVSSFPLWSRFDPFKLMWNDLALKTTYMRRVGDGVGGAGVFQLLGLPQFAVRSSKLEAFLVGCRTVEAAQEAPNATL